LGSLYAAAASYLDARASGGRWIVRLEDLDRPREIPGAAARILQTLQGFGFEWDGEPSRQTARIPLYAEALDGLRRRGLTFECSCSRLQLAEFDRYPGFCRAGPRMSGAPTAARLRVEPGQIYFHDRIQGGVRQDVAACAGDPILRRRDGIFAYLLAVVIDDAEQGVTHVVRGADLLDDTPRQIHLQRVLGLPTPSYAHVPVLCEPDGTKLAKSRRSIPVSADGAAANIVQVFELLGLEPPEALKVAPIGEIWRWGIARWELSRVPVRL
jgi:glutamyl-Q tRNA(Asp) synthetase